MLGNQLPLLPLILDDVPRALRAALAQQGIPFCDRRHGSRPAGRFVLFDSRSGSCRPLAAGQIAVDVDHLRKGPHGDPFEALLCQRAGRFEWRVAGLRLSERVARVDRRVVRQEMLGRLRKTIEQAGGIWLAVSAFPFPYRSAFNFRIDYDEYDQHDFEATLNAIAGNEQATSHFVNSAAYDRADDAWARLRGMDVGSHGYWHHTYRTKEENRTNIRRGIDVIRAAGLEPCGFVAPHGRFNRGLLSALADLGVTHSSEFGLAYDELPFFPGAENVLQIPVHPLSLGLFLEAARRDLPSRSPASPDPLEDAAEAAIGYFDQFAQAAYRAAQPVFIYGHPTGRLGRYPHVLRSVFETVSRFGGLWKTTFSELARWWRARAEVRLTVVRRGGHLLVAVGRKPAAYAVGIEYWRGRQVALMPLAEALVRFSPQALVYETRNAARPAEPVRIDRREGVRAQIRRLIDWERVTPIDQIGTGDWRNWAKRTLRRLH